MRNFPEKGNRQVHESADWRKVVERDKRVHLELRSVEESLYQTDSDSLECNSSHLVKETNENKVDFTERCDNNTNDNQRDVSELVEIGLLDSETPSSYKNRNRSGGLKVAKSADVVNFHRELWRTLSI